MAANRRNVPLRQSSGLKVDDGTMCRMPCPIPGPLREESRIESVIPGGSANVRLVSLAGATATADANLWALAKEEAA